MAVKDIIAILHKEVLEHHGSAQKYYHQVIKPVGKAGLDEIEIYRAVAEHCVENDIDAKKMVGDVIDLLEELPKNLFFVKTSERFHYMRNAINEIKLNEMSSKQFICNSCHYIQKIYNKHPNSKTCKPCNKRLSQESYKRNKNKPKPEPTPEPIAPEQVEEIQTPDPTPEPIVEPVVVEIPEPTIEPFIRFNDLMTDPDEGRVTALLEVDMVQLKQLLEVVDPYLVKTPKEKPEPCHEISATENP